MRPPCPTSTRLGSRLLRLFPFLALALALVAGVSCLRERSPEDRFITLASTTSTEQSGLFRHLLPAFEERTGVAVRVVALGSGQALDLARNGDADAVLAHSPADEDRFVSEGHGLRRVAVMHNDFVLVGPAADPAGIAGASGVAEAMGRLLAAASPFISRADRSGTHLAELALWEVAGIEIDQAKGPWYREAGQGMGQSLNMAAAMDAYLLADRGTWLSFRNRGRLRILFEGAEEMLNPYSAILVDPQRHPHTKADEARRFVEWLVSEEGQDLIANFRVEGEPLFHPAAGTRRSR